MADQRSHKCEAPAQVRVVIHGRTHEPIVLCSECFTMYATILNACGDSYIVTPAAAPGRLCDTTHIHDAQPAKVRQ